MTSAEAAITWVDRGIHPDEFTVQTQSSRLSTNDSKTKVRTAIIRLIISPKGTATVA